MRGRSPFPPPTHHTHSSFTQPKPKFPIIQRMARPCTSEHLAAPPRPSPPIPSTQKDSEMSPALLRKPSPRFFLTRISQVANPSARGHRRWPRPHPRIGRNFLLTARSTCNRRSETQIRYGKCASIRRFIPASLPREMGARRATRVHS